MDACWFLFVPSTLESTGDRKKTGKLEKVEKHDMTHEGRSYTINQEMNKTKTLNMTGIFLF